MSGPALGTVVVSQRRLIGGGWGVGFTAGELTWAMPAAGAVRYATAVVARAVAAEHDAAGHRAGGGVRAAAVAAGMGRGEVDELLAVLATERESHGFTHRLTRPLSLFPAVST